VSNFGKFSIFSDIFINLNDFLQIIGFSSILYYKYDTYFSLLKKIIYEHTDHWNTHIPRWTQKFKYLYSLHMFCNALNFYKKYNNTQIVSKIYNFWYVIKSHCNKVHIKNSSRNSNIVSKVFDLKLI
jgi:hypothetical protein